MKRGTDRTQDTGEAYGYRRGLRFVADLPAREDYEIEIDEKRGAVIVRRKSDKAIVMVVKGDRVILKVV